ncbi:3-hydroxyacyl-CoA dehydrogenase family protein [Rothia halotolerans]|uniref:3-hydroxyacyl-CoA dehydrogenase family protein n=1 Tax=Rothia halotolerans TaxID=405770 RepID=UPI00101DFA8A|nr:3-hydroxyacyl-CoA dehydrogenase family protein [Rothia halotolerans]
MAYQLPEGIEDRPIVVIGGGTLGRRIAAVFASGGAAVRLVDPAEEQREAARAYVEQTVPELRARLGRERPLGGFEAHEAPESAVPGAWLVIEAIPERLDLKRPLFGSLDRMADDDALLATNSSSYASREVITEVEHPERVLNMHFAMPPASMAVELMSDSKTAEGALEFLARELPAYGILPFIAHRESTGFIFNRIWAAIKRESLAVVAEGVSTPADVDAIMKANLGMASGPFATMDGVGLDVVLDIEEHYREEYPWIPAASRDLVKSYVDAGKLGRKSGEGFYRYDAEGESA